MGLRRPPHLPTPPPPSAVPLQAHRPEHSLPPSAPPRTALTGPARAPPPRTGPAGTTPWPPPRCVPFRPPVMGAGRFSPPSRLTTLSSLGREPAERRPARRRPWRAGAGALRRGLRRRGERGGIGGGRSSHAGLSRTACRRLSGLSAPPSIVSAPQPQSISYLSAPVNPPLIYVSFCC